jgi:outer membrane protein
MAKVRRLWISWSIIEGRKGTNQAGTISLQKIIRNVKNIQTLLNVVLSLAVAFLFYKVYSGGNSEPIVVKGPAASAKVVYVNSDSLMESYELFKTMRKEIEGQRDSLDQALTRSGNTLQADIEAYQERAEGMSPSERQLREESLMRRQQQYVKTREEALENLTEKEEALNDSVHNDLVNFLKTFNKSHGYDFIFGYQRGSGILLASDSLDITNEVLQGLNKK